MRAIFVGGPCDAQERLVNTDRRYIDARMQTGEIVRYELLLGYRDTLIYAHDLSLWRVMDLLIDNYCIGDETP
jgi:hypothetical protein